MVVEIALLMKRLLKVLNQTRYLRNLAASAFNDHQGANFAVPGVILLPRCRFCQGNMLPFILYHYFAPFDVPVGKGTATCPSGVAGNIMDL